MLQTAILLYLYLLLVHAIAIMCYIFHGKRSKKLQTTEVTLKVTRIKSLVIAPFDRLQLISYAIVKKLRSVVSVLHCFRDVASYRSKIDNFAYP